MVKILLGDVAKERRETIKTDKSNFPVVGLEHLVPEQIQLTEWSNDADNTFTKMFHKGDILFGRRRAYLKKAALAPFDGICSGDITVIAPIENGIAPELLPFIIQNDDFFDYAIEKSAGSLSPRVKWEHLKEYEFELPALEEQKKLAKILWAAEKTKQAYKKLLQKTDDMVKSQFIEMFGDVYQEDSEWIKKAFEEVVEDVSRLGTKIQTDDYLKNGKYPIIDQGQNYISGYRNDEKGVYRDVPVIVFGDHTRCFKYVDFPFFMGADGVKILKAKGSDMNIKFLAELLKMVPIPNMGYNRHYRWLKEFDLIIPPAALQNDYAFFVEQTDKSKFELQKSLDNLNAMKKALINENFK